MSERYERYMDFMKRKPLWHYCAQDFVDAGIAKSSKDSAKALYSMCKEARIIEQVGKDIHRKGNLKWEIAYYQIKNGCRFVKQEPWPTLFDGSYAQVGDLVMRIQDYDEEMVGGRMRSIFTEYKILSFSNLGSLRLYDMDKKEYLPIALRPIKFIHASGVFIQ